jgi:hypothetical protein
MRSIRNEAAFNGDYTRSTPIMCLAEKGSSTATRFRG